MQFKQLSQSELTRKIAIWAVSIGLLFFGFFSNSWHVAEQQWFDSHQRDTEGHILGRMVKSRQDGIFSAGGLNGDGTPKDVQQEWISSKQLGAQYVAYLYNSPLINFQRICHNLGVKEWFLVYLID